MTSLCLDFQPMFAQPDWITGRIIVGKWDIRILTDDCDPTLEKNLQLLESTGGSVAKLFKLRMK